MAKLPVAYGIVLGGDEIYGAVDENGNFQEGDPKRAEKRNVIPLAGDLALELPCSAEILSDEGEVVALLNLDVIDGRIACTSLQAAPGQELTGSTFRRIPLSRLTTEAARSKIVYLRKGFAVKFAQGPFGHVFTDDFAKPKRRILDGEFLAGVAKTYRDALIAQEHPSLAVQQRYGPTTQENARRWVSAARKAGFLGPSPGRGRKGEA